MATIFQDSKRDSRTEPKKQAKVKPMSAADEKLIDNAITMANKMDIQRLDSVNSPDSDSASGSESPPLISKLKASLRRSPKEERKRTFSDSLHTDMSDDVPPEAQEAYNLLVVHGSVKENSKTKHDGSFGSRESPGSTGSGGLNFAFADSSSSSSPSRTPERGSPPKAVSRASSERVSVSPPTHLARINSVDSYTDQRSDPKPVPKPRPDVPPKRSEIPVPKPRPEIVQRVEPTPRPPPPAIPAKDTSKLIQEEDTSKQAFINPLIINEEDWNNSEYHWKNDSASKVEIKRTEGPNQISRYGEVLEQDQSPDELKDKTAFFQDEPSEPSPREIMNRLARESRLRRSIDHQRGVGNEDVSAPNRNLREPQGIPGKSFAAPNGEEEEEVDTNPLRMLRGGVIPVRGGRAGSGTNSTKPTLRHPKLHFNSPGLQHSVSVDAGSDRVLREADREADQEDDENAPPPKLPPRSISVCDSTVNPLPLPPRNPLRPTSLNQPPAERKYPLILDDDDSDSQTSQSPPGDHINDKASSEISKASSDCDSPVKPLSDPLVTACKTLHATDSSSYSDLPLAPLPPVEPEESEIDDNVFDISDSPRVSIQLNLSSDGGSSGAATFPRGLKLFGLKNVKCNLEQLGFYNHQDPFWVKTVTFSDEQRCYSDRSTSTDAEASPLMLANYKTSDGVSYEDLLDFAIDR